MLTKNLLLRIFFYSILVISSIHFINIKAMIESRFNTPFLFENFSVRAVDDLLPAEFIEINSPEIASSVTTISNGMININGLEYLDYSGSLNDDITFYFPDQDSGFYGENIGYFRFNIISPYPEAKSVVYVINNSDQYTYDLVDGIFEIDHPLAETKDGINWTPINWGTQNLLIKFIDDNDEELGIKSLVISNRQIEQKEPTIISSDDISSETYLHLMSISDGEISFLDINLESDGSTDIKGLNFVEELEIGNSQYRYFSFSFDLTDEEVIYSNDINFFINDDLYDPSDLDKNFIIQYDKENKKIIVYFAVVKINDDENFVPYYDNSSNSFSLVTRLIDNTGLIRLEKIVSISFNITGEAIAKEAEEPIVSDLEKFPAEQFLFNNEALIASDGEIGFDSNIFLYQREESCYLVDEQLNNKHIFSQYLVDELNPDLNYIHFTLNLNLENPVLNSLKFENDGENQEYDFSDQNSDLVYVFNRNQELDFYYPISDYLENSNSKSQKGSFSRVSSGDIKWEIDYSDGDTEKNYQYYFNVNLDFSGIFSENDKLIELPTEAFYFEDEYLNEYSQKSTGFLYFNHYLTSDLQKRYINQDVSKFSRSNHLRYFKINFRSFETETDRISYEISEEPSSKKEAPVEGSDEENRHISSESFNYFGIDNIEELSELIILEENSLYIPAFDYSSKKLVPYSFDHNLILNFIDKSHNIYPFKLRIASKPNIENKNISSTPVVETKIIEPMYKETYNSVTGELTREKINREVSNVAMENINKNTDSEVFDSKLLTEAQMVDRSPKEEIKILLLTSVNVEKSDVELEKRVEIKHQDLFVGASTPEVKISLKNYLAYGTESTVRLGEGQRAATVINYTNVKGDIPQTESDIEDVLKIANNRVPLIRNSELEPKFLGNFYRLNNIIKENNITKIDENNLILDLNQFLRFSYGILPMERSIAREKWAIELFVKNYNKLPQTDGEWRIVNSWAYRNVLISQVENNLDWINSVASENMEITVELLDRFFELIIK